MYVFDDVGYFLSYLKVRIMFVINIFMFFMSFTFRAANFPRLKNFDT